jgi:hypothetical protein
MFRKMHGRLLSPLLIQICFAVIATQACRRECPPCPPPTPVVSTEAATVPGARLPDSAFKVEWGQFKFPSSVARSSSVKTAVIVTNRGTAPWPDEKAGGISPVRLNYRWWKTSAQPPASTVRQSLPATVRPSETQKIDVTVQVPDEPGEYNLQFDLVQELVAWFADKGADRLIIRVRVTG